MSFYTEFNLTYEEKLLLKMLAEAPRDDTDCIPHRVLINLGYAKRRDDGLIEITANGREALSLHQDKTHD